jgi:hypothetical protein
LVTSARGVTTLFGSSVVLAFGLDAVKVALFLRPAVT